VTDPAALAGFDVDDFALQLDALRHVAHDDHDLLIGAAHEARFQVEHAPGPLLDLVLPNLQLPLRERLVDVVLLCGGEFGSHDLGSRLAAELSVWEWEIGAAA